MLQWCYSDATVMLQWCYSDVTVTVLGVTLLTRLSVWKKWECEKNTFSPKILHKCHRLTFVVRPRPALVPAADDFETIIKVGPKCSSGIFPMLQTGRDGTQQRPQILITAGITAPPASLSVQRCNHQLSAWDAQVAAAPAGRGGGEQMDNVSFAFVLWWWI